MPDRRNQNYEPDLPPLSDMENVDAGYTNAPPLMDDLPDFSPELYGEDAAMMDTNDPPRRAGITLQPTNMQFDFSVFDRLAAGEVQFEDLPEPVQQLAQAMTHLGIRPTSQDAARYVMQRQQAIEERADPLYQARVRRAEAEALKAEQDADGTGVDRQGWERYRDENGNMRMRIIPGGPAERQIRAQNKFTATAARTVIEDANRADALIGFWTTGLPGLIQSPIPFAPGGVLSEHLKSVRGNIAVDNLLNIKKSGAGLGQVPQSQLNMLSELLGVLNIGLPADVLRYTLRRSRDIYEDILATATEEDMRLIDQAAQGGAQQPAPRANRGGPPQGSTVDESAQPRKVLGRTFRKYTDGGWYPE